MKLWIASMECAGIIEAGGVKSVTYSLCKEFSLLQHNVTLFIPVYKTNEWSIIKDYKENVISDIKILHCGKHESVSYSTGICTEGNFKVVFLNHPAFAEKEGVYTYTEHEQQINPENQKGKGHRDTLFLDSLFAKAVCEYGNHLKKSELPDIIHCQDASTALIPAFITSNPIFSNTKNVVTIHNAGPAYHHAFSSLGEAAWYTGLPESLLSQSMNKTQIEPFLLSVNCGAYLTTVSETYAKELCDPFFDRETEGLSSIFFTHCVPIKGITNGIDYDRYNPQIKKESCLPFEFNPEELDLEGKILCRKEFISCLNDKNYEIPDIKKYGSISVENYDDLVFLAYHGRITNQKGIAVLIETIPAILRNYPNARFIITGQGQVELENELIKLTIAYSGKVIFLNGYEKTAARLTTAVSDLLIMPSYFEPCGLEDFIAQIYGTLPVANKTGGLNKILNYKTGFLYTENNALSLTAKLSEVITFKKYKPAAFNAMIKTAAKHVHKKYLWENVIKQEYLKFFKEILKK